MPQFWTSINDEESIIILFIWLSERYSIILRQFLCSCYDSPGEFIRCFLLTIFNEQKNEKRLWKKIPFWVQRTSDPPQSLPDRFTIWFNRVLITRACKVEIAIRMSEPEYSDRELRPTEPTAQRPASCHSRAHQEAIRNGFFSSTIFSSLHARAQAGKRRCLQNSSQEQLSKENRARERIEWRALEITTNTTIFRFSWYTLNIRNAPAVI